jgi:ribosome biogenesis protein Nip4
MPFDPNKPVTLGPLSSAEIRENFRALKEDRIVDAGWLSGFPISAFVLKSTPTVITAVHTFNPTTAGAPFTLGANAQGQLVTGLNADTVDGQHASAFATASHNHDTTYVRKGTADTITAVHTFSPSTASAPFILDTNAQGQLVAGLNADTVDGQHASAFAPSSHNHDTTYVRKGAADTITAVHTFNPSSAGAPFILGSNAQGRLVTGLNADTVDGQHAEAFSPANHNHDTRYIRKDIAETISVIHTFNPTSAGAPFTLGANAQGQLVTGLNADTVDGQHASAFAPSSHNHDTTYVRKGTSDTITAVHTFNPSSAGAPFILGANAQGQLVTGLNADTVDGQHANAFASSSHNHDTTYVRKGAADTITAVHTFNPSSAGAPFSLGANAQGQLVTGLNADTVDGQHGDTFVRKSSADTITAVHTFNPSSAGAPFILGANAQGRLVTGLNADTVDGQHGDAFVRKSNADTITAVHTFNPSSAGAPFILGANAQGRLVTGLNADTVDGKHAEEFAPANHNHDASYVRKGTADTITAVHTFNPSSAGAPFILGSNAQGRLVTGLNADMIDGMHASEIARNTVIDLSNATEDYLLPPFSTAVINFSDKYSVPLRIATTNNSHYEIRILPHFQNTYQDVFTYLLPNNQSYQGQFHTYSLYHDYILTSAFLIGYGLSFSITWVNNTSQNKRIFSYSANPGIYYNDQYPVRIFLSSSFWNNATTPWTSLGTISFPITVSGTIIIHRLI